MGSVAFPKAEERLLAWEVQSLARQLQVKYEHQRLGDTMQRMPISTWKWECIIIDFVVGFTVTLAKYDIVWVIVDSLTKSAHFIPMKTSYNPEHLSRIYICEIVQLVRLIQQHFVTTQSRQKRYAGRRVRDVSLAIFELIFLKVSPTMGVMKFLDKGKINPWFIGPFEILER
ncbi:hypothetical protein MTR67_044756 [Solanum verrucosum]|uniref:Uncharacterized protein n=1 Tax=Solanum verrucosum TaxID=315347 RepID=A0AAF0UUJ9_SOLVR|nr:hypothetical protein MTR67_044756 [Solanum verrucosum]